ncbi:MAG: hypothetical protein SPI77_04040 [Corynebacterium sp.]|nr:hypothetical protein [Corynebacterium sp.]
MDQTTAVEATYNPAASRTIGIDALKELRAKVWDLNPPYKEEGWINFDIETIQPLPSLSSLHINPLTGEQVQTLWNETLQDAARSVGITTKEQYLNVISDPVMVAIAVQRAVEESVLTDHTYYDHNRPYNQSCLGNPPELGSGYGDVSNQDRAPTRSPPRLTGPPPRWRTSPGTPTTMGCTP